MKRALSIAIIVLLAACLVVGVLYLSEVIGENDNNVPVNSGIQYSQKDIEGKTITIKAGDTFKVANVDHGGAPMQWTYELAKEGILEFTERTTYIEPKYETSAGGPVNVYHEFKAVAEGSVVVTFYEDYFVYKERHNDYSFTVNVVP